MKKVRLQIFYATVCIINTIVAMNTGYILCIAFSCIFMLVVFSLSLGEDKEQSE